MPHIPPAKRHPYDQWSPDARALDLVGDKWTLLIVRDLISGPRRFVELQRVLPGISTEQLRSRLNRMVADGMLTRKRYREVPPRVDYELTERAMALAPVIGELARWGYDWSWGAPRPLEAVDVGAIFRLLPGLLPYGSKTTGRVDFTVIDGRDGDETTVYSIVIEDDGLRLSEHTLDQELPAGEPDSAARGDAAAWVRALGPDPDLSGLDFSGRRELTSLVLETLAPDEPRAESVVESAAS